MENRGRKNKCVGVMARTGNFGQGFMGKDKIKNTRK